MPHHSISRVLALAALLTLPLGAALAVPGDPIGTAVQVSTAQPEPQMDPDIALVPDGRGIYVWGAGLDIHDSYTYRIMGRRVAANGVAQGADFRIDTGSGIAQTPRVATDAAGNFVVVWQELGGDNNSNIVFGNGRILMRRYTSSGVPLSAPVVVDANVTAGHDQMNPAIAMNGVGQFVISWHSWRRYRYGALWQLSEGPVMARRYAANGTPLGDSQQVASRSSGALYPATPASVVDVTLGIEFAHDGPDVDIGPAGNFVVAWTSGNLIAPMLGNPLLPTRLSLGLQSVQVQRFDAAGTKQGRPSQAMSLASGEEPFIAPAVALAPSGGYSLAWMQDQPWRLDRKRQRGTYLQRYDASGKSLGAAVEVYRDSIPYSNLPAPAIAVDNNGNTILAMLPTTAIEPLALIGVASRVYASDGSALGPMKPSASIASDARLSVPRLALRTDGDYQLTWASGTQTTRFIVTQRIDGP